MTISGIIKSAVLRAVRAFGYDLVRAPRPYARPLLHRLRRGNDAVMRTVKANLAAAPAPVGLPTLGARWGVYAQRLRKRVAAITTAEELLALGQSHAGGIEHSVDPETLLQIGRTVDLGLRDILPPHLVAAFGSIASPPLARPTIDYGGRKIDFVTLCAAETILPLLHRLPESPRAVCDIGGGTGKYIHAWATNAAHVPELLVILDTPETLIYADALLRTAFADREIHYLTSPTGVLPRAGIILCPLSCVDALRDTQLDLITNTGSMQEMPDVWIDWYMDWLDRQPCHYFYSSNYCFHGLDTLHQGHNSWSPRPSPRWRLLHSAITLGVRSTAQLVYERSDGVAAPPAPPPGSGAAAWLALLETARCRRDVASYRAVLDFADGLAFTPKEAWQVARWLAAATGTQSDRATFEQLDAKRRAGTEALLR